MKTYLAACLAAMTASIFIAATAAWPVRATPMARRAHRGWLLRAMSEAAPAGTLTSVPNAESDDPQSL